MRKITGTSENAVTRAGSHVVTFLTYKLVPVRSLDRRST